MENLDQFLNIYRLKPLSLTILCETFFTNWQSTVYVEFWWLSFTWRSPPCWRPASPLPPGWRERWARPCPPPWGRCPPPWPSWCGPTSATRDQMRCATIRQRTWSRCANLPTGAPLHKPSIIGSLSINQQVQTLYISELIIPGENLKNIYGKWVNLVSILCVQVSGLRL